MARCFWFTCSSFFFFYAAVVSEAPPNGTLSVIGNVTGRDGREYNVHPPTAVDKAQSLSSRPKSLGTGSWKAIKIWNEPIGISSSSTAKQASSPERVVASSARRVDSQNVFILFVCSIVLMFPQALK